VEERVLLHVCTKPAKVLGFGRFGAGVQENLNVLDFDQSESKEQNYGWGQLVMSGSSSIEPMKAKGREY
jgi:hypothetical protein